VFVARVLTNGSVLDADSYGGTGQDYAQGIEADDDGNIYITGSFSSTATFGTSSITSSGSNDVFLAKINSRVVTWAYGYGGNSSDIGYDVAVDMAGNVFVAGAFSGSATFGSVGMTSSGGTDMFVVKTDPNGTVQWAIKGGGTNVDVATKIEATESGDVCVTGNFRGSAAFGSSSFSSSGLEDIFLSRISAAGNYIWSLQFGSIGGDWGQGIAVDSDYIYTTGKHTGDAAFGAFNLNTSSGTNAEEYALKISLCNPTSSSVSHSACGSYMLNGQSYATSGLYTQNLVNSAGCDSTISLNPSIVNTQSATICFGESYTTGTSTFTSSGTYTDVFTAANGCDSTRTLTLTVLPQVQTNLSQSICIGESFAGYTATGTYTDVFTAANGCDSTRTLNLTVLPVSQSSIAQTICSGESFAGYTATGIYGRVHSSQRLRQHTHIDTDRAACKPVQHCADRLLW
jgi:hypothetical protein